MCGRGGGTRQLSVVTKALCAMIVVVVTQVCTLGPTARNCPPTHDACGAQAPGRTDGDFSVVTIIM